MSAKVLVIGSGGREHALAWKLRQSPRVKEIFMVSATSGIPALLAFAREHSIDLTIVGPDDVLALGVVDAFQEAGFKIFGPTKAAAEIEASKAFSKAFMVRQNIPTARFQIFTDYSAAKEYIETEKLPIVIKTSGLALGKGVVIARTLEEAEKALQNIFVRKIFGEAGREVVIEEFLEGPEISIHVFSDGKDFVILPTSQDHKAVFDGGQGPNTGGMGTVAPLPWVTPADLEKIKSNIVEPALAGLAAEGRAFSGLLYPGLKMTVDGPKVLEFNARWGDPETQSYMRLLKSDIFEIFLACAEGRLAEQKIEWNEGAACCVILASGGYPGAYEKGKEIFGIEEAEKISGVVVFHAGTSVKDGKLVTNGGRVLGVTAIGADLTEALGHAYEAVGKIKFEGMHYRKDIGRSI